MQRHGGNLDEAIAAHGGTREEWLDLSTGINPVAYPLPPLPAHAWTALPTRTETAALAHDAACAFGTVAPVVPLAGASQAIALAPLLIKRGKARILGPTYAEHAVALDAHGWKVKEKPKLSDLEGSDLAVVVNPNNPDGRRFDADALLKLARKVKLLIVDESFADPHPDLSLASRIGPGTKGIVVQRSFGKFYGLAGLRLGFALAGTTLAARIAGLAGPWPVSGPAVAAGRAALADTDWQSATVTRLAADAARMDTLAEKAGWALVGGTSLFRTYDVGDAARAQAWLAEARIWSRIFESQPGWLRLGLPDPDAGMERLAKALA